MSGASRFEDFIAKAAEIEAAVRRVRAQGAAAMGRVRVEVAAEGRITELFIADELRRQDATVLARLIREAHDAALEDAKARVAELRVDFVNDPSVARLSREVADSPDPDEPRAMPTDEMDRYYERLHHDPLGRSGSW